MIRQAAKLKPPPNFPAIRYAIRIHTYCIVNICQFTNPLKTWYITWMCKQCVQSLSLGEWGGVGKPGDKASWGGGGGGGEGSLETRLVRFSTMCNILPPFMSSISLQPLVGTVYVAVLLKVTQTCFIDQWPTSSLVSHTLHRERKGLVKLQLLSCHRGT